MKKQTTREKKKRNFFTCILPTPASLSLNDEQETMNEREASTAAAGGDGAAGNQRGGTRFLWEAELVATYEHLVQRLRLEHEAAEAAVEQAESERAAALATGAQRAYDPNWVMMNERRTLAAKDYHSFRGQYDDLKASIAKERAAAEGDAVRLRKAPCGLLCIERRKC